MYMYGTFAREAQAGEATKLHTHEQSIKASKPNPA